MWNLAFPATLKAYIDYVSVPGITFKYTAEGAVGLLENKKAVNIVSRGGAYSEGSMANFEMGDRYLRTIFGFFGIRDFQTIATDKCDVQGIDVDAIVKEAKDKAISLSKNF